MQFPTFSFRAVYGGARAAEGWTRGSISLPFEGEGVGRLESFVLGFHMNQQIDALIAVIPWLVVGGSLPV